MSNTPTGVKPTGILAERDGWHIDLKEIHFAAKDKDGSVVGVSSLPSAYLLGKGSFATVTLATYLGTQVAVKIISTTDPELRKYITRELSMLRSLRHPNIVQFIGTAEDDKNMYLVMEYVPTGNLRQLIKSFDKDLSWKMRTKIALECAKACAYLHSKNVIHRDLKSKNLLLDANMVCKVCDFGLARVMDTVKVRDHMMSIVGTDEWMAPEVMLGMRYDFKADVFSYGVVLIELITRDKIKDNFQRQVRDAFSFPAEQFRNRLPKDCPMSFGELAIECVHDDPQKRPTFIQIIDTLTALYDVLPPDTVPVPSSSAPSKEEQSVLYPGEILLHMFVGVTANNLFHQNIAIPTTIAISNPVTKSTSVDQTFKLLVTNYRVLYMKSTSSGKEILNSIPFIVIGKVETKATNRKEFKDLEIFCYNFKRFSYRFQADKLKSAVEAVSQGKQNQKGFFAFQYKQTFDVNGWNVYDSTKEYLRQGIPSFQWRVSTSNLDYSLDSTYPKQLVVPSQLQDSSLATIAANQSVRIPVVAWHHSKRNATMLRSSELKWKPFEELMLNPLLSTNSAGTLFFVGTDIHIKSVTFKNNKQMNTTEFLNYALDGPEALTEQYTKLISLCLSNDNSDSKWLSALESTNLLKNVKKALKCATDVAELIDNGHSVLVIDKTGHDRTCQITSLAMLMLDSYYRTIEGFAILIEKEWCSFGHRFAERILDKREYSPLFFEFMDCVFQLWRQFPSCFEFNENLLILITEQLGLFGNFLFNSEKERESIKTNTHSVWSLVLTNVNEYKNRRYLQEESEGLFLTPDTSMKSIQFWSSYYAQQSVQQATRRTLFSK